MDAYGSFYLVKGGQGGELGDCSFKRATGLAMKALSCPKHHLGRIVFRGRYPDGRTDGVFVAYYFDQRQADATYWLDALGTDEKPAAIHTEVTL